MMLSSIVYGFGSYKAYDNKAYKAYDNKAYNSLNPFGSHMRLSLVCSSPFFHWILYTQEFGVYVCVGYALIFLSYPHTLSVYLPLRENAIASLVAVLL